MKAMIRRLLGAALILAMLLTAAPALAQSDTGEIDIVVQDASSKKPVVLARVMLDGPVIARGFNGVTSQNFEVTDGRVVTVSVALAQSQNGPLRTIASEVVKSSATI